MDNLVAIADLRDRIFSKECRPSLSDYNAWRDWQRSGAAKPERKRRERKPTLASVAKQARSRARQDHCRHRQAGQGEWRNGQRVG
jgi:hypothetical protein